MTLLGYQLLLEVGALLNGVPTTLRFSGKGVNAGGYYWEPGLVDPGLYQVNLFSGNKTYGASSSSVGVASINNLKSIKDAEGPKDGLADYIFGGRPIKLYIGPDDAAFPSGYTTAYTATVQSATINWDTVSFVIRGRQAELDLPLDTGVFLGNNDLPLGLEGTATDLKDKEKPAIVGRPLNITPVLCNTSKLIYAVSPLTGISADEYNSIPKVYDNGVELSYGGTVALADIYTTTPNPGSYLVCPDGYFRLGSSPTGTITCTFAARGYALQATPANIITQVLALADQSSMLQSITLTDRAERGVLISGKTSATQLIDSVLAPSGYWYFDREGKVFVGQMVDPATMTPVFTAIADQNIGSFTRRKVQDTKNGVPASKVTVRYAKNYTIQANVDTSAPDTRKLWIEEPWRMMSKDADILYPFSEELLIDTAMTNMTQSVVDNVHALYTVPRELVDIDILPLAFLSAYTVVPGQCVALDLGGRFGYSGKKMVLVGCTINYKEETIRWTLWG